jgi:DNA-binding IclR family transcriptional regulator
VLYLLARVDVGRPTVVEVVGHLLVELAAAVGETAGLSVPEGDAMHYVEQVESEQPVGVRDWTGSRIALHAVSSGLAVLALRSRARIDAYLGGPLERFTERTMTDPADLRARLQRIQLDGYAWTNGEYAEGIASVAAGIADGSGEVVAAIHVHGPAYGLPVGGSEARIAELVVDAAARVSGRLRRAD